MEGPRCVFAAPAGARTEKYAFEIEGIAASNGAVLPCSQRSQSWLPVARASVSRLSGDAMQDARAGWVRLASGLSGWVGAQRRFLLDAARWTAADGGGSLRPERRKLPTAAACLLSEWPQCPARVSLRASQLPLRPKSTV
eukprot:evm.model.scf_2483.3 EVM.evm.TU.scf_2483.3   scf_2483:12967-13386(-)